MSEPNKAVVRLLITEVLNGGRLELIDEPYSPELAPGARRWITPFRASFPDVHMEIVDLIAEGDKVVGRFTLMGTHKGPFAGRPGTGHLASWSSIRIYRLADGKVVETWAMQDRLGLLQQIGAIAAPEAVHWAGGDPMDDVRQ